MPWVSRCWALSECVCMHFVQLCTGAPPPASSWLLGLPLHGLCVWLVRLMNSRCHCANHQGDWGQLECAGELQWGPECSSDSPKVSHFLGPLSLLMNMSLFILFENWGWCDFIYMLHISFYWCYNKLTWTYWLKTTQIYFLEVKRLKSRPHHGFVPTGGIRAFSVSGGHLHSLAHGTFLVSLQLLASAIIAPTSSFDFLASPL
jgi:hypothetical protein